GEFRSTRAYPGLESTEANHSHVFGLFPDSWIPLHGYRNSTDLRSGNQAWNIQQKMDPQQHIYCGPGVWYDRETHRIHIRLAHTTIASLGDGNYTGPTDPRKLPLVISGGLKTRPLEIAGA